MTARDHNNLLGIFYMVQGGLIAFAGIILILVYGIFGLAMLGTARHQEEQLAGGAVMVFGVAIGIFLLLFSALYFFTGMKVRRLSPTARIIAIILSCLSLFSIPIGTALGVYGLWFLLGDMGKSLYLGAGAPAGGYAQQPPPPPNSWQ